MTKVDTALSFHRRRIRTTLAVAAAALCSSLAWSAEPERKSGYAIGSEQCGGRGLSFPRLKIDMNRGFCAG